MVEEISRDSAVWEAKFNTDLKKKSDQKFSHLLCDVKNCSSNQLNYVNRIVFQDPLSARYWHDYIVYCINKYPNRKTQIYRLLLFAIDVLGLKRAKEESAYVRLHLLKASLASNEHDARKQYETMWSEGIGRKYAQYYIVWCDLELKEGRANEAKEIINKGISNRAHPSQKLTEKLMELNASYNDGEIEFSLSKAPASMRRKSLRSAGLPPSQNEPPSSLEGDSEDEQTRAILPQSSGERTATAPSAVEESKLRTRSATNKSLGALLAAPSRVPVFPDKTTASTGRSKTGQSIETNLVTNKALVLGDSDADGDGSSDDTEEETRGVTGRTPSRKQRSKRSVDIEDDADTDELTRESRLLSRGIPIRKLSHGTDKGFLNEESDNNACDESVVVFKSKPTRSSRSHANSSEVGTMASALDGDDDCFNDENTVKLRRKSTRLTIGKEANKGESNKSAVSAKDLKKKYVDEKLMNFDPSKLKPRATVVQQNRISNNVVNFEIPSSTAVSKKSSLASNGSVEASKDPTHPTIEGRKTKRSMEVESSEAGNTALGSNADSMELCDSSTVSGVDETVAMKMVSKQSSSGNANDEDDEIEFASKKRSLRSSGLSTAARDSSSDDDGETGLANILSNAESSPMKTRRASKSARRSDAKDVTDKENNPVLAKSNSITNSSMVVLASAPAVPASVKRSSSASKEKQSGALSQGTFQSLPKSSGTSVLSDPDRVIVLNGKSYVRLSVLGQGGSSCVYLVLSELGALYAYKKVDVRGSDESADSVLESYVNEIKLLNQLKGSSRIIELIDSCVSREDMSIAMVLEAGDVDLAKVLSRGHYGFSNGDGNKNKVLGSSISNPFFLRTVWGAMLEAVDYIHENRIVHGDLKPANFVFVRGHLKLIDFGIAKAMSNDTTNIYRDSQVGTINYMAPEAISPMAEAPSGAGDDILNVSMECDEKRKLKMRLGRASDIWSLGCILFQMLYGKTPFSALNTIQKLHAIPNPKYEIIFPTHLNTVSGICCTPAAADLLSAIEKGEPLFAIDVDGIDSVKRCLRRPPNERASIKGENGLLSHPFLDLEAARSVWHKDSDSTSDCLSLLTKLQSVLQSRKGDLCEEEKKMSIEVMKTLQRAVPSACSVLDPIHSSSTAAVRRSSRSTPMGHLSNQSPSIGGAASVALAAASRKMLPRGLKDQIQGGETGIVNDENVTSAPITRLQKVSQSKANKWVRPHNTPEKNDMRSVLEKKFGQLRKFLGNEDDDDDSTGLLDDFSIQNL